MAQAVQSTRLPNGMVVVTEQMPRAASASVGVWLDVGSRDESPSLNGISHLFEHMVFKGTRRRTGLEIVQSLEHSGGQINAFTTKEQTCFYAKVVADKVPLAIDVLLDMALEPNMDGGELLKEKEVVMEELKGADDNPDERVYDLFGPALYGKHSSGFPIAGTVQSVRRLNRSHLMRHLTKVRGNIPLYVIAAGAVDHKQVVDQVRSVARETKLRGRVSRSPFGRKVRLPRAKHFLETKDIQQANVMLGAPGFAVTDPRAFPLAALNCVLGEGMSSRLFQTIREEYGYVYHINSFTETMVNTGMFGVSFSTDPKSFEPCLKILTREFRRLKKEGITTQELDFAKENLRGAFLLETESNQSRMNFLARVFMYKPGIKSREDYLRRIEKITRRDINQIVAQLFRPSLWASATVAPKGTRVAVPGRLEF